MHKKSLILCIGIIALSLILTACVYFRLPRMVATHFNMNGEADGFSPRRVVFIIGGAIPAVMVALFAVIPRIDPKSGAYKKHRRAYEIFCVFMVVFLTGVHWLVTLNALGFAVPITAALMCATGVLFLVLGNYSPQIRPNYSFGIRLPWTLSDENNWRATHRVGGWSFGAAGLVCIIAAFVPKTAGTVLLFSAILFGAGIPVIYSFRFSRKKK